MLKKIRRVVTAAVMVGVLITPITAQEPLGFTIDPTQGIPGTVVSGRVDVDDVAASCVTDLAEFQARFDDLVNNVLAFFAPDPLWMRFFPPDVQDIISTIETHDQLAYTLTLLVAFGIAINEGGAAEQALPQTFVITFIDLFTQEPLGELGSFDPMTGEGSVVVPNLQCGPQAVAAVCVGPTFDRDALEAGIRESGDFLEAIGAPPISPIDPAFEAFAQEFLGSTSTGFELLIEFATAVGPTLVQNIVIPDAVGVQIFNITCPPTDKDQCKNGGWQNFPGFDFKNQGQCVAFVETGKFAGTTAATVQ